MASYHLIQTCQTTALSLSLAPTGSDWFVPVHVYSSWSELVQQHEHQFLQAHLPMAGTDLTVISTN